MNVFRKLWQDESGYVLSAEAALVGTIGVVGATVGLSAVSKAVDDELKDVAYSIRSLDQSYCVEGVKGCGAWTAGSSFVQPDVEESKAELGEYIQHLHDLSGQTPAGAPAAEGAASVDQAALRREFEQRERQLRRELEEHAEVQRQSLRRDVEQLRDEQRSLREQLERERKSGRPEDEPRGGQGA
jgi:hypothetical protein